MSRPQAQGDMFMYLLFSLLGWTNYGYVYVLAYCHGYVYIHTLEPICLYTHSLGSLSPTIVRPRKKHNSYVYIVALGLRYVNILTVVPSHYRIILLLGYILI